MHQKNELPEGWEFVSFEDVLEINPSKPPKDVVSPDTPVTFVPMPAVDAVSGEITDPEIRPFSEVRKGYTAFQNDDVIFAKITPCMENGKAAVARNLLNNLGFGSTEYIVFRSKGAILPDYLYHYIRQESYRKLAESNMTGSVGQKRVPKDFVQYSMIPLPPLSEQHRIVSAIEALFARLDATNEKLDRVQEILKKFRESVLAAACDGRLTEEWRKENLHCNEYFAIDEDQFNLVKQWRIPTVWSWSTLEDSCSHVVDCPHSTPKWTDIGVYCVRTSELKCGHIDFSNAKYVSEATYLERIKRLKPQEGDILYSREGTVGIASLVPSNVKICLGQRLMLFRTKNNLIPSFFVKVLNSPYIYDSVKKSTMGSTAPRFNVADIKKFPTPLPPLPEQQEIVRRVDALFAFADSIETKVAAAREKTEKLRQSILAKAFSGELVETEAEIARREGRDYETAEVLLERIKEKKGKEEKRR